MDRWFETESRVHVNLNPQGNMEYSPRVYQLSDLAPRHVPGLSLLNSKVLFHNAWKGEPKI